MKALNAAGIITLEQLNNLSEKELLSLHGVRYKAVRIIKEEPIRIDMSLGA